MSSKCDPHEICEECPEWIFTLADLLMCMMGLFVIMWVIKPGGSPGSEQAAVEAEVRRAEMVREIQLAFGARLDETSEIEIELAELLKKLDQIKRNGEGEKGNTTTQANGATGTDSEVTKIRDGDLAGIGGRVNYDAGAVDLDAVQKATLDEVAGKIRGHRNVVLVKGHAAADDLPEGATADRQMTLALDRAKAVAAYLATRGVSPDILRVQGCGAFEPVRLRAYADADRRANRRVEVEATDQLVQALSDAPSMTPFRPAPPAEPTHPPADPHGGGHH